MEITNGTVEILMENDPKQRIIHPILLDINDIQIEAVLVRQFNPEDNEESTSPLINIGFNQALKNGGKLLELDLKLSDLKLADPVKLSVVVKFASRITNTLQGIYKVDYRDDFGTKAE